MAGDGWERGEAGVGVTIPGTGVVLGLPPKPWPLGYVSPLSGDLSQVPTGTYPDPPWGPPGTRYVWTLGQLLDRCIQLQTDGIIHSRSELDQLLRGVLEVLFPAEAADPVALEAADRSDPIFLLPGTTEVPMANYQYVTAQIHAKLGTREEVSHTLALVHSGTNPAPDTLADSDLHDIAQGVGQAWTAFIQSGAVLNCLSTALVYDHVTVAAKSVTGPAPKTGSRKGLVRNVGDSVQWNFPDATTAGGGNSCLPYQDALVLTLGTQKRGGSYRGRLYLGGLSVALLPTPSTGLIDPALATNIGLSFGTNVVAGLARGAWHVNVWSARLAAGREVASVSVGDVIDTMQSRRESLPENRVVAWGTL